MPLTILTPPASLPVTIEQIRQHLRLDHEEDDEYLLKLAEAATAHCEAYSRRCFVKRTLRQYEDCVDQSNQVKLKASPVIAVDTVTGFDPDGSAVTVDENGYDLKAGTDPTILQFSNSYVGSLYPNGLEIDYRCGYGAGPADMPAEITRALLVLIGHWYEHRGTHSAMAQTALVPDGFDRLLQPLRRVRL